MAFIYRIKSQIEQHSQKYLWLSIVLFILLFVALALKKYYYFAYNISDLAIFNQTFFNTLQGRWFAESITLNNYFADHFSPAIVLLLPFYAIKQSAVTLLVIQVTITALCAWPIYLIAKQHSQNNFFAYVAALLWLVNPFVQHQVLFEFHMLHLMVFLFFWSFYFYQIKKIKWFTLFFILTLFTREDASFLFLGLAILSVVEKRSKKISINIFFWSFLYFIISIFVIKLFSTVDSFKFLVYYDWLGGDSLVSIIFNWVKNPLAVVTHIITFSNVLMIFYFFLPFLFIPLFSKKYLYLSLFPFLQFIMSNGGIGGVHLHTHYVMLLVPGIYLAYIFGLWSMCKQVSPSKLQVIYNNRQFFVVLFIFSTLFFLIFDSPVIKAIDKKFLPNYHQDRQKIVDLIPDHASVCADSSLLPALSMRTELYNIDYAYYNKSIFAEKDFSLPRVDYIFTDMNQFFSTKNDSDNALLREHGDPLGMPDRWGAILADYSLTYAKDNIFLWQNKDHVSEVGLPYFEPRLLNDGDVGLIKEWSISQSADLKVLKIVYNKLDSNSYLVRFYQGEQYWETPFDYGLYSLAQNQANQTFAAYYYLNNKADSFEIYRYEGFNTLGDWSNLELLFKREKVFDKVNFTK